MELRFVADLPSIYYMQYFSLRIWTCLVTRCAQHLAPRQTLQAVSVAFEVAFLCLLTYLWC